MSPDDIVSWLRTHVDPPAVLIPPGPSAIERMKRSEQRVSLCHDARCHVTFPHPVHTPESAR